MNNRLKLYNDTIYTYLNHTDKIKLRKIAFKNKMTLSELNRKLIQLLIKLDENNKIKLNFDLNNNEISSILGMLGGIVDK